MWFFTKLLEILLNPILTTWFWIIVFRNATTLHTRNVNIKHGFNMLCGLFPSWITWDVTLRLRLWKEILEYKDGLGVFLRPYILLIPELIGWPKPSFFTMSAVFLSDRLGKSNSMISCQNFQIGCGKYQISLDFPLFGCPLAIHPIINIRIIDSPNQEQSVYKTAGHSSG